MDTEMENQFVSDDICLVSFLLTQPDVILLNTKTDGPGHFVFVLSDPKLCTDLKQKYLNNASAPARQLFSQREMLISEIKTRNRNGDNYGNNK